MSEITPLVVTLELPASELIDHDNGLFVRCPLNGQWVPITDYYSENQGALLPLVGNVDYAEAPDHWTQKMNEVVDKDAEGKVTGSHLEPAFDDKEQPIMVKVAKENVVVWKEVVRILAKVDQPEAEGGTLKLNVNDAVKMNDQMV